VQGRTTWPLGAKTMASLQAPHVDKRENRRTRHRQARRTNNCDSATRLALWGSLGDLIIGVIAKL